MKEERRRFRTNGPEETERLATQLARLTQLGDTVGLKGELGAGKTCFTRGFARGFSDDDRVLVSSPTYSLLNVYQLSTPIYHFDLYRLTGFDDLETTGYWDVTGADSGIAIIEWCDRIPEVLESLTWLVELQLIGEDEREVIVTGPQERLHALTVVQ